MAALPITRSRLLYPFWSIALVILAIVLVPVGYLIGPQLDDLFNWHPSFLSCYWESKSADVKEIPYKVQVFNVDPLILYI